MLSPSRRIATVLLVALTLTASLVHATDVDGPDDCVRTPVDFGDAPDGVQAYLGVLGRFPTCSSAGPIGTQELACAPISTPPGPTGFVRHNHFSADTQYWLGCIPTNQGIDSEFDGKVNDTGGPLSACVATGLGIDCVEAAFGLSFGQDECYGSTDAGIATAVSFTPCASSTVTFNVWNCGPPRQVYVNVLVDWNHDGDWNDNFQCPGACSFEWAVKNVPMLITTGCTPVTPPAFVAGPNVGEGWMRVSISDGPVTDDFPWAGSAPMPNGLRNGETEDYPITIDDHGDPCPDYEDWGDAPEVVLGYPSGVVGHFPTCALVSAPGTQELVAGCLPISTPPGPTGHVRHVSSASDPFQVWLGCGDGTAANVGVDTELNGKTNDTGAAISSCDTATPVDCVEAAFGMSFGQDECYADPPGDAGVIAPVVFTPCAPSTVTFNAFSCATSEVEVYLNILVDWNEDGDWNDVLACTAPTFVCAYEWAVKNVLITLPPGCSPQISPVFIAGPNGGNGWMRITLSPTPVSNDFPWRGSFFAAGQDFIQGGETEDYPVTIEEPCDQSYRDFGDAPEGFDAYAGIFGLFPTCVTAFPPGDQDLECGLPQSSPPGPTGFVMHVALPDDPYHFWLGCDVDSEVDGKTNPGGPGGSPSFCNPGVLVDCAETPPGGLTFGQDECYGDAEAALGGTVKAEMCSLLAVEYTASLCEPNAVQVYLNVLADWNRDGDWNDNVACKEDDCAYEWAVKNVLIGLSPGCNTYFTPPFLTGPFVGPVWMRMSLSATPAPDDYPWNGTASIGDFKGGETEDYVILITPETTGVPTAESSGLWFGPVVPNPARDRALVDFALPRAAEVSIAVYDLAGRRVAEIERGFRSAGLHHAGWNFRDDSGRDVPLGYYILKLRVGDEVLTRRVIRVK